MEIHAFNEKDKQQLITRFFHQMSSEWKQKFLATENYDFNCAGFALGTFDDMQFPKQANDEDFRENFWDWDDLVRHCGGYETAFFESLEVLKEQFGAILIADDELDNYSIAYELIFRKHDFHFIIKIGDMMIGKQGRSDKFMDRQQYYDEHENSIVFAQWFIRE